MDAQLSLLLIVAILAVVQALFGMGILVFGTPTLLLLGFEFTTVLGLLLPASMSISTIQVLTTRQIALPVPERRTMLICAIAIGASLVFLMQVHVEVRANLLIGFAMVCAALARYSSSLQDRIRLFVQRSRLLYVAVMGILHGLTNMGGALLAIYAATTYHDKEQMRTIISRYYLLFGVIQLCTLAIFSPSSLSGAGLIAAPVAIAMYYVIGNVLFRRAQSNSYDKAMTAFIGAYGAVVLIKIFI